MDKVAVVIPFYKNILDVNEKISLARCYKILGHYPIIFVCPHHLENQSFHQENSIFGTFVFLNDKHFSTIESYNHLMLSSWFYKLFLKYQYILIHQLDCQVFKDELMYWVSQNYSYIGAPWFTGSSNDASINTLSGVGNGGFSLRKVKDCINVLDSRRKVVSFEKMYSLNKEKYILTRIIKSFRNYIKSDSFFSVKNNKIVNEDKIFCSAGKRFSDFNIPIPEIAMKFAFEMQPSKLLARNNNLLPFGCHAVAKYDHEFFVKYILNL